MRGARSSKNWWMPLAAAAVIASVFTFMVPVFGAEDPDVDRLRLTGSVDAFFHGSAIYGEATDQQPVNASSDCQVSPTTGSLVTLTSSGAGAKGPGIFDHGIGVKSGGANGTPCSQTEGKESLSITSKFAWHKLRLDVEAKGNAWIYVDLTGPGVSQRHQLLTGSAIASYNSANPPETPMEGYPYKATTTSGDRVAACANPNDSGPDSNINDNCLWTIEAGAAFTKVTISVKQGSVSLEGGNDYVAFDGPGVAAGDYDSLFYRIDLNDPPVAVDDLDYEVNERVAGTPPDETTTPDVLTVASRGVLTNDTDADHAATSLVAVSDALTTSEGASVTLNADGSFTYVPDPRDDDEWEIGEFSYFDTWDYTVADPAGGTDVGTVGVTVHRVICSGEEVGAVDEGISGSFTLLPDSEGETPCKRYEVYADASDPDGASVTLVVPPDQDVPVFFRGLLTFDPVTLDEFGTFTLGIEYDPDNEGELESRTLQVCLNPMYDSEGLIVSATLPPSDVPDEPETWCLGGALTLASGSAGELDTVFQVYGTEDPKFVFK